MKPKLFFKRNSSTILTVLGCAGVVATAVLSVKAAPKAKRLLANAELEKGEELTVLEKTETVALTYLPAILTVRRLYSASAEHKFLTSTSKHLWRVHTPC